MLVFSLAAVFFAYRLVLYAVYTLRSGNKTGGIVIAAMAAMTIFCGIEQWIIDN